MWEYGQCQHESRSIRDEHVDDSSQTIVPCWITVYDEYTGRHVAHGLRIKRFERVAVASLASWPGGEALMSVIRESRCSRALVLHVCCNKLLIPDYRPVDSSFSSPRTLSFSLFLSLILSSPSPPPAYSSLSQEGAAALSYTLSKPT